MNKIFASITASALLCASLASCTVETYSGTSSRSAQQFNIEVTPYTTAAQEENAPASNTPAATQAATTAAAPQETKAPEQKAPEITAPQTTAAPQGNNVSPEYITAAKSIMINLNDIDMLDGGAVSTGGDVIDDGMYRYSNVTDPRFYSLWDVETYVESRICGDLLYKYNEIYTGDVPMFKEFNGGLYYLQGGRGCGYSYTGEPTVSNVSGGSFTFTVPVDYFGASQTLVIDAVNDGGLWKACSLNRQ